MRVRLFARHAVVVLVPVMLVVNVHVIVLQALVGVCVPVPLAEEQGHSERHERADRALAQPEPLVEQRDRRDGATNGAVANNAACRAAPRMRSARIARTTLSP